jgi:hypothetical protein
MLQLKYMSPAETEVLRNVGVVWTTYGPALRDKRDLDGGMAWKLVNGHEYLTRYRQDPETGKKKWTSMGRRSPETEAAYDAFMGRRDGARQAILGSHDEIALSGRLAKAHGLTRLPVKSAEIIRSFWHKSLDKQIKLFCGTSLLAYEQQSNVLTPAALVRDDSLLYVFDPSVENVMIDEMLDAYESAVGEKARVRQKADHMTIQAGDAMAVELVTNRYLLDKAEGDDHLEVLANALKAPAFTGLTVARDGQPVEIKTFSPQSFALMAYTLGLDDEVWAERAQFAAAVVRDRWEFDPDQEAAFPEICFDGHDAPPRM